MKKTAVKVLVPILALLMLLSMASSAKAYVPPPTKIPVTVYITGETVTPADVSTLKYVVSNDIMYLLYFTFSGTIAIKDPSTTIATVNWVDVCWGTYNIATGLGSYTFFEVWTITSGQFAGGQLVGFDHPHTVGALLQDITGIGAPITALEAHIIVVGIGACAGQVIDVSSPNLLVTGYGMTGYWLTP